MPNRSPLPSLPAMPHRARRTPATRVPAHPRSARVLARALRAATALAGVPALLLLPTGCVTTVNGNDTVARTVETAVWYDLSARPQGSAAVTVRLRCGDFAAAQRFQEAESGALFEGTPENTSCTATLSGTVGDYVVSGSASGRSGTDLDILASPSLPEPLFLRGTEERGWVSYIALLGPPGAEVCWTTDGTDPLRSGTCAVTSTGEVAPTGTIMWAAEMSLPSAHPALRARSFATGWTSSAIIGVPAFSPP